MNEIDIPKLAVADAPLEFCMKPESFGHEVGKAGDWARRYLIGVCELKTADGRKMYRKRAVGLNKRSEQALFDWGITDLDVLVGQKVKFTKHVAEDERYSYYWLSSIPMKLVKTDSEAVPEGW